MFTIKSYIKYPHITIKHFNDAQEKHFVDINNYNEIIRIKKDLDLNYLKGAIYLIYNDQIIIDFCYYDMVDQLWGYLLNMMEEFLETNKSEMSFPDHPTPIEMKNASQFYLVFSIGFVEWTLPKHEFFTALLLGAKDFFEKLMLLIEEEKEFCMFHLRKIEQLKPKIMQLKKS